MHMLQNGTGDLFPLDAEKTLQTLPLLVAEFLMVISSQLKIYVLKELENAFVLAKIEPAGSFWIRMTEKCSICTKCVLLNLLPKLFLIVKTLCVFEMPEAF